MFNYSSYGNYYFIYNKITQETICQSKSLENILMILDKLNS